VENPIKPWKLQLKVKTREIPFRLPAFFIFLFNFFLTMMNGALMEHFLSVGLSFTAKLSEGKSR
jgi:hypothetical protein